MSNISAYSSYSADFMYPVPVVNHGAPLSTNPSMYPMVLQILAQLRAVQSEWNAWKMVSMSFQNSLQREQQLRLKDKLNFHFQEQQLLNQIDKLRLQLDKTTEANATLHRNMEVLKQNLSICKDASFEAKRKMQDLEHLNSVVTVLKENILNLTKIAEKKEEILLQTVEEAKRNQEKLQDALQKIKDKDTQLEDIRNERKALKESLELTKEAIENLKAQEQENQLKFQLILEQKLNVTEANLLRQTQVSNVLTKQWDECHKSLTDLKNNSKEGKHEIGEELNRFREKFSKLAAQEAVNQDKIQKVLEENLNIMAASLTKQTQLNEELTKQKDELKKSLADLKNKSECEKHEINEELKRFKDEITKLKTEERESQSKLQSILKEKLNVVDIWTKQVQLNEELRKQKEELQTSLADLKRKSEGEKQVISEELRMCKETTKPVIGACGPAQLKQMKMPQPEGGLYKTALQKNMLPGCVIQVFGSFKSSGDTPSVNLDYPHGIALHIVFRFSRGHICRNTYSSGKWGTEETGGGMPVQRGQQFNLTITSTTDYFQICMNGVMFATYKHRIEKNLITGIWIAGPIDLKKVLYFAPTNI